VAAESSLTRTLAERAIDDVLTTGRAEVAERILRRLQDQADAEGLGVSIRAVRLGRVAPPVPVAPAFADAARARSDLRQALTRAEEYSERAEADARSQSREIADRAAARFERLVQRAKGEADRFAKVLAESRKDLDATRRRLYLEALATLLPRFTRKVVVPAGQDLDVSLIADDKGAETGANAAKPRPTPP
jgi:membrane protease subunit HflK